MKKTRQKWYDILGAVLLVYNNRMVHSSIKMTPNEARKPSNELNVKLNLQLNRTKLRKYPSASVGDTVRLKGGKINYTRKGNQFGVSKFTRLE